MSKNKCFVNLPMLDRFTAYHRERLKVYARMFDAAWEAFRLYFAGNDASGSLEAAEIKVDEIAAVLAEDDSYMTDDDEYLMVNDFLNGLRCGLERKGWHFLGVEFRNDHSLVETVIDRAVGDWRELRKKYRNTAQSTTEVFCREILDSLPDVNELYALLAAEYAKAREILLAQPEMPQ